jgi:acetyl esterase/lipase
LRLLLIVIAGLTLAFGVSARASGEILPALDTLWHDIRDFQMRVEQRIIIRFPNQPVSPPAGRADPRKAVIYNEEKIGRCLMMDRLIASRPGPKNSLELVTRERQLIRAYLGDGCLAREFYAGAYVERSSDGRLCVDRDILHARTGAKCEIDKFRLLVPE